MDVRLPFGCETAAWCRAAIARTRHDLLYTDNCMLCLYPVDVCRYVIYKLQTADL